jgi:hypothetical protein
MSRLQVNSAFSRLCKLSKSKFTKHLIRKLIHIKTAQTKKEMKWDKPTEFHEPHNLYWCHFQRRHSQTRFCFPWLCEVLKSILLYTTLMYPNGLERANMRKHSQEIIAKWLLNRTCSKNEKLKNFLKISLEDHTGRYRTFDKTSLMLIDVHEKCFFSCW